MPTPNLLSKCGSVNCFWHQPVNDMNNPSTCSGLHIWILLSHWSEPVRLLTGQPDVPTSSFVCWNPVADYWSAPGHKLMLKLVLIRSNLYGSWATYSSDISTKCVISRSHDMFMTWLSCLKVEEMIVEKSVTAVHHCVVSFVSMKPLHIFDEGP